MAKRNRRTGSVQTKGGRPASTPSAKVAPAEPGGPNRQARKEEARRQREAIQRKMSRRRYYRLIGVITAVVVVAGAIAGVLRERGYVDVQVIGAAALNQAVKAIAISRSYVAAEGLDPICIPGFQDIEIGGEGRTAIRIRVEDRAQASTVPPVASPSRTERQQAEGEAPA